MSSEAHLVVAAMEEGESGTLHVQGAIKFKTNQRFNSLRRYFDGRGHWEQMRGTLEQNYAYCTKDVDLEVDEGKKGWLIVKLGKWEEEKGRRNDLEELRDAVLQGATRLELFMLFPRQMAMYRHFVDDLMSAQLAEGASAFRRVTVHVLWGEPGSGKSRDAVYTRDADADTWTRKEDLFIVPSTDNLKWWNNYSGQGTIVLDEFTGSTVKFRRLLRLVDGHQLTVETKGAMVDARWTEVFITSNKHPDDWWDGVQITDEDAPDYKGELSRRITTITQYRVGEVPEVERCGESEE